MVRRLRSEVAAGGLANACSDVLPEGHGSDPGLAQWAGVREAGGQEPHLVGQNVGPLRLVYSVWVGVKGIAGSCMSVSSGVRLAF